MTRTEKHNQALAKIQELSIEQNWSSHTLLDLVLEYFKDTEQTIYLAGFLAAVAKDEK